MRRDARTAALGALATLALTTRPPLTRRRRQADPLPMTKPSAEQQVLAKAVEDLQPGALIAFYALPAGGRLVEVVEFSVAAQRLSGLDLKHGDMPITLTLGQIYRGYTIIQRTASVPNTLGPADLELLRTRVDQRG